MSQEVRAWHRCEVRNVYTSVPCAGPNPTACLPAFYDENGIIVSGRACEPGHGGVLCALCDDGFYRYRAHKCKACEGCAHVSRKLAQMCVQRRVPPENTDSCVRAYVRREFGDNVYATCVVLAAVVTTLCIWIAVRHCCNEDHYHMILDSVQLFFFRVGWESFRILLAMMQILGCAHPRNLAHIVCDMSQAV